MADHTLQETLDATTASNTSVGSIVAFVEGLKQQVADFASGARLSAAVQAGLNQIFDQALAEKAAIDVAMAATVPPEERLSNRSPRWRGLLDSLAASATRFEMVSTAHRARRFFLDELSL